MCFSIILQGQEREVLMPRSYNVNICRNYDTSINVMVLMKTGIDISEKNECVYAVDGDKFKTWVA